MKLLQRKPVYREMNIANERREATVRQLLRESEIQVKRKSRRQGEKKAGEKQ